MMLNKPIPLGINGFDKNIFFFKSMVINSEFLDDVLSIPLDFL